MASDGRRIALLSRGLSGGGVQAMMRNMAAELTGRGYRVDLLYPAHRHGRAAPEGVAAVPLRRRHSLCGRRLAYRAAPQDLDVLAKPVLLTPFAADSLGLAPALARYLAEARPAALISATTYANLVAIWARAIAGVETRILVSERDNLAQNLKEGVARRAWRWRHAPALIARTYPRAEAVVGVSDGVADSLYAVTGLARDRIATVYNPVVTEDFIASAAAPPDEPWLAPGAPPVILSAGRLVRKKDFQTLLAAFASLRRERPARLIVLGKGRELARLEAMAARLGVAADVKLGEWTDRPAAYMARAAAFALSSTREGFGNVLAEALACGCPVVSTDCPSGPAEILDHGRFGRLTPPGDADALAAALKATLDAPPDPAALKARGLEFTAERATTRYLELLGLPQRA